MSSRPRPPRRSPASSPQGRGVGPRGVGPRGADRRGGQRGGDPRRGPPGSDPRGGDPRGFDPRGKQRRSFSQPSAPGRIERGGDPALADALADALAAAQSEPDAAESFTHPFHTYPARMHPATARRLLALAGSRGGPPAVLDPFCGSGTTLVEARRIGARALGSDLNPLAVAIARAKTWTAPLPDRKRAWSLGREVVAAALAEVKAARRAGHERAPLRRVGRNPGARNHLLGEWFAPHVRRELETLGELIDDAGERDRDAAEVLQVVLSSVLYKVSQRSSDTDPRRVTRQIARGAAARLFDGRLTLLFEGLDELATAARSVPPPRVVLTDARRLGGHAPPESFDIAVTSPPYAGTYDYADQHRMRMVFLGMDPGDFARGEIGARARFAGSGAQRAQAMDETRAAMGAALGQIARALVPGGRAAVVMGDSLAGGEAVRADQMIAEARGTDPNAALLVPVAWARQERMALGRVEAEAFHAAPKREHVLLLERRGELVAEVARRGERDGAARDEGARGGPGAGARGVRRRR